MTDNKTTPAQNISRETSEDIAATTGLPGTTTTSLPAYTASTPPVDTAHLSNVEREKLGLIYTCLDPAVSTGQREFQDVMTRYNPTFPSQQEERRKLLHWMLAEVGRDCTIETPVNSNWGCRHVHLCDGVYINSNVTFVDDQHVYIGDHTMVAPNVMFVTDAHPVLPSLRERAYQYDLPIHVGRNVWIGAATIILPGITIGDNLVIGAGSVVDKDIPTDVVAYGVPCRVAHKIGERDRVYYHRDRRIDINISDREIRK